MLPMWGVRPGEVRGAGRQGRETGWIGTLSCSFLYRPHYTQQRPAPTLHQQHTAVIGCILQSKYLLHSVMRQASCAVRPLSVQRKRRRQPLSVDDDKICLQNGNFLVSDHVTFFPLPAFLATFLQKHIPTAKQKSMTKSFDCLFDSDNYECEWECVQVIFWW